eukprot:GGOE01022398.1.p1 GENE.GGOE01022398.1~~GGOE01022398.1.p1  ORF type:complete len:567 (-),score=87.71 GGOE01022398.1:752-2215(-)
MANINSDVAILMHLIGDSDTSGWTLEHWTKVVVEARKSSTQETYGLALAVHDGNRRRSVSPSGDYGDSAATLSWLMNLIGEFCLVLFIWCLSGFIADFQTSKYADGDVVFEKLSEWVSEEVVCLSHAERPVLFARMLLLPSLVFSLFYTVWPAGFHLLLVSSPFIYGLSRSMAPQLAPFLQLKLLLLLPHTAPPSGRPVTPLRPVARERRLCSVPPPESLPWNSSPLSPPLGPTIPSSPLIKVSPAKPFVPTSLNITADRFLVGRTPVKRGNSHFHEAILRVADLHHSDGWEKVKSQNGIVFELKVVPWASTKAARFTCAFDCPLEAFGSFLLRPDSSFKVDSLLEKKEELERVDDNTVIFHNVYKSPMVGVGKREFVVQMTRMYLTPNQAQDLGLPPKRTFVEAAASCEHPGCPSTAEFIRSKSFCAGYLAQEEGANRTHVINLGSGSPEGWIPSKVADAVSSTLLGKIQRLQRCVEGSAGASDPH